jgi:hypothetical protein
MQEQRRITNEVIDEISGVIDFIRAGESDPDEKATMTMKRSEFINKRFGKRMKFYENNSLHEWMEWQCVLNRLYLPDAVVAQITGKPIWPNPFALIKPIIPLQTFDFQFEGSAKAAQNPVQAQILLQMLDVAKTIPPGIDENGQFVKPNLMAIYRDFVRKSNPDEDVDKYSMPATELDMMMPGAAAGGGPGGGLGAVTPGDLLASIGTPKSKAGVRQEAQ